MTTETAVGVSLVDTDLPTPTSMSRRTFLGFCSIVTAALALPQALMPEIAHALSAQAASGKRLPVVWLAFQDCTGDTESFLRSFDPTATKLLFDLISLDYHETLMVPAGAAATTRLDEVVAQGGYVCIVEGSIPTAFNGACCTINGRSALSIAQQVCSGALLTIAAGTCSTDGGIAAAKPNPTLATGVLGAVPGAPNVINMPGCPVNGVNLVAAIAYWLTYQKVPPLDSLRRPLFAYGNLVHHEGRCERYKFYDAELFVRSWGDEGSRKGWCLKHMGCNGPSTHANCYTRNWNQTSWPVRAGHPCLGCTTPGFWDKNTPFYVEHGD